MNNLFNKLSNFFQPAKTVPSMDNANEPAQITQSRVLVIVYDPIMERASGRTLSQTMNWYRTADLITGFLADMILLSKGMARYQIVQRIDVDEFPVKTDGFRYTPESYMNLMRGATSPHVPQGASYDAVIKKYNILQRVASHDIDEVWVFGFPQAGFYESTMGGPGAFWCNAPPLKSTEAAARRFVVMGFSYERYIGEMLEAYGHRAEAIMEKTFSKLTGEANLWKRFTRYEKESPGKAACGTVHFAPNSLQDYDWNNPTPVQSECYDWLLNFPHFKGDIRPVNASEWGNGDMRNHHAWWLNHFPRVAGRRNGVHNNWWQYIANPNNVFV